MFVYELGVTLCNSVLLSIVPPPQQMAQGLNYIDAGTGSLIIQILIGGLAGSFVLLGVFWRKVKAFFGRHFSRNRKDTPNELK